MATDSTSLPPPVPVASLDPRAFARHMCRFELRRAHQLRDSGRPDRAAMALRRALLWRKQAREAPPAPSTTPASAVP